MRFLKIVPLFAMAATLALGACAQEGADEGETELTPADTAATTLPPAPMPDDTMMMGPGDTVMMMGDTMMMDDTTHM